MKAPAVYVFIILSKCLESLDLDCERMPGIHGTGAKHSWYRTLVISGKLYYNRRNEQGTGRISDMAGFGTIVNVAGILAGCRVGLLLKGGLPKRLLSSRKQD